MSGRMRKACILPGLRDNVEVFMKELEYPFDSEYILKKSKKIRRQLLESGKELLSKKIAVLGGSTTHDIIRVLEVFLLNQGIRPQFYESEYAQYWQDVMFDKIGRAHV